MIVEQIIFTFISFAIFVLMFFRMIKNNDTTYVVILVLEAIGISLNFLEVLFDIKLNIIFVIIKYILAILLPILIIILEKKGISLLEMLNIQKAINLKIRFLPMLKKTQVFFEEAMRFIQQKNLVK